MLAQASSWTFDGSTAARSGGRWREEDLADAAGVADSRVDRGCLLPEPVELALQQAQLRELARDRPRLGVDELEAVRARRAASVANSDHGADLGECQAGRLRGVDEREPVEGVRAVVPVPARGALRCGQDTGFLVEAQRLGRDSAECCQLADQHGLDLPVQGSPYRTAVDLELLYVADCPNVDLARHRIVMASERAGVAVEVRERQVTDVAEAAEFGMRGSPTILVLGADVSRPVSADLGSVSCRLYRADAGVEGAPTVDDLVAALTRQGAQRGTR